MKRLGPTLALGFGIFFLALAILIKFVVAPIAVKAPLQIPDKYQTLIADGQGLTVLSSTQQKVIKTDVRVIRHIQGDTSGSDGGNGSVAVYEESLCLVVDDGSHPPCDDGSSKTSNLITAYTDRVAFDRKSGLAINPTTAKDKYKANVDGDPNVEHHGLAYKFPIDTEKKTYPFMDTVVGKAFDMVYKDTEKLQGLTVYKFVQTITDQPVYTNRKLPSLYSNTRTTWVEPTTGAIIKGSEDIKQVLTGRKTLDPNSELSDPGFANVVALQGLLTFDEATQKSQAQLAKDNLPKVHLVRLWLPLIAGILGVLLIVVGILGLMRRGGDDDGDDDRGGHRPGGRPDGARGDRNDMGDPDATVPRHVAARSG